MRSRWTVTFRGGLMRWRVGHLRPPARSLTFDQLSGDFQTFEGSCRCERATGTLIVFTADFDLGIPTLAAILDPVAESTLRTNIRPILPGLLGAVEPAQPSHV